MTTDCQHGAKYVSRELAESTRRMLRRTSPAARYAVHCGCCGFFHLISSAEVVAQVGPALSAGRPEAVSERKIA